jgi:hypothetical protein
MKRILKYLVFVIICLPFVLWTWLWISWGGVFLLFGLGEVIIETCQNLLNYLKGAEISWENSDEIITDFGKGFWKPFEELRDIFLTI